MGNILAVIVGLLFYGAIIYVFQRNLAPTERWKIGALVLRPATWVTLALAVILILGAILSTAMFRGR